MSLRFSVFSLSKVSSACSSVADFSFLRVALFLRRKALGSVIYLYALLNQLKLKYFILPATPSLTTAVKYPSETGVLSSLAS